MVLLTGYDATKSCKGASILEARIEMNFLDIALMNIAAILEGWRLRVGVENDNHIKERYAV